MPLAAVPLLLLCAATGVAVPGRDADRRLADLVKCAPAADSTALLMAALNKSHTSVTLTAALTCVTEPLVVTGVQNLTITLEQGAELQAKRGSQLFGVLLRLESTASVTVQGAPAAAAAADNGAASASAAVPPGQGAYNLTQSELTRPMIRMWREDYADPKLYPHSEHRHALSVHHCSQLTLHNLRLANSGGDGIYIESVVDAKFDLLTVDHNFRQGISVIEAQGLLVADSVFAFTAGTAPMAGIDFEPDTAEQQLSGVAFRSCRVLRNAGAGIQFALHAYTAKTKPVSVQFNDTLIVGPTEPCVPSNAGCYLPPKPGKPAKPFYRWGILVESFASALPAGQIRFAGTTVVDTPGWSSPPVWVEKMASPGALTVDFSDLVVNMSNGGPAITMSAILPTSGGANIDGAVIDRRCCPGGSAFLTAQNHGPNQLVNVAVTDVRVQLSSSDNASQAVVECNPALSDNARSNDVAVSNIACGR